MIRTANNKLNLKLEFTHLYPLAIILICSVVFFLNFTPNTWQTGWDTLHPEFNWSINLPRHLFGMWQDNQGLGSVGGHSHASDTSRILVMMLLDIFLPSNLLRYAYLYLTLVLGPLGVYFLLEAFLLKGVDKKTRDLAAFLAALFYLFNLGTVQQYVVQLEMYTVLYAAIPWYFLAAGLALFEVNRKHLIFLFFVCILGAPMAYSVTVFLSMLLCLGLYLGGFVLYDLLLTKSHKSLWNGILVVLFILVMNMYWLLPSLYFGAKYSGFVGISNINTHFSRNIFEYNVKHGNLKDLLFLKGFLVEWENYDFSNNTFRPILEPFNKYLARNPGAEWVWYLYILIGVIGIIPLKRARIKYNFSVLLPLLLAVFMFLTLNPPFGSLFVWARDHAGVLKEMFRNPYTKFSVELELCFATFFGFGVATLFGAYKNISRTILRNFLTLFTVVLLIGGLFYHMLPYFKGDLISRDIRVNIPAYYFDYFDWMNSQEDSRRIALLPIHNFWGWRYYDWGYQGAGFIWFGTKQPVLDRDFDRWNHYNEEYYFEMSDAIYNRDLEAIEAVTKKYGVGYIVVDSSVIDPTNSPTATYTPEINKLLLESNMLKLAKTFGSITVYKVLDESVGPIYTTSSSVTLDYPFQRGRKSNYDSAFEISEQTGNLTFSSVLKHNLYVPGEFGIQFMPGQLDVLNFSVYASLDQDSDALVLELIPIFPLIKSSALDNVIIESSKPVIVNFPMKNQASRIILQGPQNQTIEFSEVGGTRKAVGSLSLSLKEQNNLSLYTQDPKTPSISVFNSEKNIQDCSDAGEDLKSYYMDKNKLYLISTNKYACIDTLLPYKQGDYLYKITLDWTNLFGNSLLYCFSDSKGCELGAGYKVANLSTESIQAVGYAPFVSTSAVHLRVGVPTQTSLGVSQLRINNVQLETFIKQKKYDLDLSAVKTAVFSYLSPRAFNKSVANGGLPLQISLSDFAPTILLGPTQLTARLVTPVTSKNSEITYGKEGIQMTDLGGQRRATIQLNDLVSKGAYLFKINSKNMSTGMSLALEIRDLTSEQILVNQVLKDGNSYYVLAPTNYSDDFKGYTLTFINNSVGKVPSSNMLYEVGVYTIPLEWLSSIMTTTGPIAVSDTSPRMDDYSLGVTKVFPFLYKVTDVPVGVKLILQESYEGGWWAYGAKDHFRVNGWANGWMFTTKNIIYIIFWPGLIQIVCYIPILFMGILLLKPRHR